MKKLLLILSLCFISTMALGDIYNIISSDYVDVYTKNKVNYYFQQTHLDSRSDSGSAKTENHTRQEFKNYMEVRAFDDWFKISSTVGYYKNGSEYNKDKDLGEVWLSQDRSNVFIEKLYFQQKLAEIDGWKFSFAYGIIPLTGGNFKKFSNQDGIQGNGIFTLIDLNLQGGFFIMSNENHIFKIGQNYWKKDNWQHDEKLIEANDGTNGTFVFYEYKTGKHLIELNYVDADVKYKEHDMANAQMYGLGYSYDDSIDTGFIYYGTYVHSVWNSKMEDVLNAGVFGSATNTIKWANTNLPALYDFDNDTQTGNAIMLGVKYYTEILGYEADIGVEYFKTSKNFSSFNNGSLFYNDYGFWRRRGSDMVSVYSDFKVTKDLVLSLKYSHAQNKYTAKNGSIADVTETPATHNFYKREDSVLLKVSYEF